MSSQAADYFIPGSLPLLTQYVRHCDTADVLAKAINSMAPRLEDDLPLANKLFAMAARESAAIAMLATKLRFAQSARFDNKKRLPTTATRPEALAPARTVSSENMGGMCETYGMRSQPPRPGRFPPAAEVGDRGGRRHEDHRQGARHGRVEAHARSADRCPAGPSAAELHHGRRTGGNANQNILGQGSYGFNWTFNQPTVRWPHARPTRCRRGATTTARRCSSFRA